MMTAVLMRPIGDGYGYGYGCGTCSPHRSRRVK